jgi:hypothetical protein
VGTWTGSAGGRWEWGGTVACPTTSEGIQLELQGESFGAKGFPEESVVLDVFAGDLVPAE